MDCATFASGGRAFSFIDVRSVIGAERFSRMPYAARVLADTELAIPALTDLCKARVVKDAKAAKRIADRKTAVKAMHDKSRAKWRVEAREGWDSSPISLPRLAMEVWEQIKNEDWVLTTQAFEDWALKLWDFDKSYRWPGKALGTGIRQGVWWRDMGVVNLPGGRPTMQLTGGAKARLDSLTPAGMVARIDLSITDEWPLAQAFVVISAVPAEPS